MEEVQFIDAEQYQGNSNEPLTYKMIVLNHLKKISNLISQDLRGGYWQTKMIYNKEKGTMPQRVYVPDAREPLTNSIDFFYYLLLNKFKKDKSPGVKKIEELYLKLETLKSKCVTKTSLNEQQLLDTEDTDTLLLDEDSYESRDKQLIEMYKNIKVKIYREILKELLILFNGGSLIEQTGFTDTLL